MDILREITDNELAFIVSRLEENLPYAIKDLHFILAAKRTKELSKNLTNISEKLLPKFYVPQNGSKENCTIFGITDESDHTVWCFTFQESLEELRECLEKTKLINWNKRILFVTIHKEQTGPIFDYVSSKSECSLVDYPVSYYWLPIDDALKLKIE
jgi:Domain of unknown function (DUF5645)